MEDGREKWAMLIMKSGKRETVEGIKVPNQESIRTLREKEKYMYLGILEADTIKQVEMKENIRKSISNERESFSKPNTTAGISPKRINIGTVSLVRYSGPFLKWTRRTPTDGPEDKKIDDYAEDSTFER